MTCKDCLHYEICEALYEMNGISKIFPSQCTFYKNNKMNNWISVEDRLPKEDEGVLVCVNGIWGNITFVNAIQIAVYSQKDGWIIEGFVEFDNPAVEYWMPLPEPPKGEKKDE